MKILALAADEGGCGFYRIREPARVAAALGVDITVASELNVEASTDTKTNLVTVTQINTDADLIIFQRPLDNAFTSAIEQAKRQGIATLVEFDDDFDMINTNNSAHAPIYGQAHSGPHWLSAAAKAADHISISTPTLEKYGHKGRMTVLRNCVPESVFSLAPAYEVESEITRIGWTGTVQTHPNDLQVTRGTIGSLAKDNELAVSIVGDGLHVQQHLGLDPETPFTASGWIDLDKYYEAIRDSIDIGIVPLEMSNFNHAKSALKGLEYAALGIPFVASGTREYERLALYGVGKVALTPKDWKKHIQKWIDQPARMIEDAKKYREIVYNENVYEHNASQWIETWEKTIAFRKNQS